MNLKIRRFCQSDLPALYKLLSDPAVMRYLEPPFTLEKTQRFFERAGLCPSPLVYAAENEDGAFLGYVIYHSYGEDSIEIGWVLKRECWGKGYAGRLTKLLLADAKQTASYAILECVPEQVATRRIALHNNFVYCGEKDGLDIYKLQLI